MYRLLAGQIFGKGTMYDIDNAVNTGFYYVDNGEEIGAPNKYGVMLVFRISSWYDVIQIYFSILSNKVYYRLHQSSWGDWISIN